MKNKNQLVGPLLALFLVSLAACHGPGAERPSATPTPRETQQPHTLLWEVPQRETLSYEEYFAQERAYEFSQHLDSAWFYEQYDLKYENGSLYLVDDKENGDVLWKICDMENLDVKAVDYEWIYGIVDGEKLIRMDYWGENQETLFEDESGLISTLNRHIPDDPMAVAYTIRYDGTEELACVQNPIPLADSAVMYFWAGAEDGDGAALYRLYVPDGHTDVMYQYTQKELEQYRFPDCPELEGTGPYYRISAPEEVSNMEVRWSVGNPEFFQRFEAEVKRDYEQLTDTELIGQKALEYHLSNQFICNKNAYTGAFQRVEAEM